MREEKEYFFNEMETFELVQKYEELIRNRKSFFFDVLEYESIINFYLDNDELTKATESIQTAIGMHPYSPELQQLKAELLISKKNYADALGILTILEKIHTEKSEVYFLKGQVFYCLDEFIKAEEAFKESINNCLEDKSELIYRISNIYFADDEFNLSIKYLLEAHRIDPTHFATLFDLGYCYEKINDLDKSYFFYNKLLDSYTFTQNVWYNLGIVLSKQGKFDEAIEAYDYCIAIDPSYIAAYHNKANTLASIEKYNEAIKAFQELIELEPENPRVYCSLGECYEKAENWDLALEMYHKTISKDNTYAEAFYGIGVILNEKKEHNIALDYIKKAIALDSEQYDFWLGYGKVTYELNNIQEALNAYREATSLNPDEPDAFVAMAEIYLYQEKYQEVKDLFDDLSGKFDENASLVVIYAASLYLTQKRKEALDQLKIAKNIDSSSIDDFFNLVSVINDDDFIRQARLL